jgi:hypothetical protein
MKTSTFPSEAGDPATAVPTAISSTIALDSIRIPPGSPVDAMGRVENYNGR